MGESRNCWREPRSDADCVAFCYGIDQQGGKGGANWLNEICPTILSDSHGTPHAVCYATVYDARGNGGGGICPTITGNHQDRITDYTAIVVQKKDEDIHGEEIL